MEPQTQRILLWLGLAATLIGVAVTSGRDWYLDLLLISAAVLVVRDIRRHPKDAYQEDLGDRG